MLLTLYYDCTKIGEFNAIHTNPFTSIFTSNEIVISQIYNGVFNMDALEFPANNPKIATKFRTQCGAVRHTDKCEFAARLQKCIEDVIRKTPTSHFPPS